MEKTIDEDDERLNQLNVALDASDHNASVITTTNEEAVALVNERNGSAKSDHSVESTSQNRAGSSNVVQELKSHDNKVFKCRSDGLPDAVGKHLGRNEQLSERETELRKRLAALEYWIPTLTLIKILTGEIDSSNIRHLIREQTMSASTSNSQLHASLSQHNDSRIRDIEAERKEAHRRLEMARKLLLEKQSAIDERAKQIEEAERKHTSLEQKIGQLEEQFEREGVDLMKVTSRESVISFGHDHLACIIKLEELVASEEHTKRQLEELERREEAYMNTLRVAGQVMQRNKKHPDVDEIRDQLQVKSVANQQMADRIVFLEDQVENLKDRLARCNDYVERLTTGGTIESQIPMKSVAAGSDYETVKRKNRGVFATVRSNSKETLTRVELTDRSVQEAMADNRRQNENHLLRNYDNDDDANNIVLTEPLNADVETMYPNSFNQIAHGPPTLPSIDESHTSTMNTSQSPNKSASTAKKRKTPVSDRSNRADKSTNAKFSRHVDSTFQSLPSRVNNTDWSTFSDINDTHEPMGTSQRLPHNNVSFVSLQSTIASDNEEPAMRPISKDRDGRVSPRRIQTDEVEYDEENASFDILVPPHRPNRGFVSIKSNADGSAWSTFSNIHESGSSEGDKRPAYQQDGTFLSLASTLPHTTVDQNEDIAPRRPIVRTVIDPNSERQDQAIGEIPNERIELTRIELEMWLHNINDIRRHISRCPICVSKKRALALMCKAICHYLRIQFNVCTDNNENDTAPIAAREGEVYTIQNGVLRLTIGKKIPPRGKRDEQLLRNEIESAHSPRKDAEPSSMNTITGLPIGTSTPKRRVPIDSAHHAEPPSMNTITGLPIGTSTPKRRVPIDSAHHEEPPSMNTITGLPIGTSTPKRRVPIDSAHHEEPPAMDTITGLPIGTSTPKRRVPIDSTHYEEPPAMDTITGLPIGTSTPKRRVPIDSTHYEEPPAMDTITGLPIGTSTPKRRVPIDSTHYEEPPAMDTITGLPIGTSTPKQRAPIEELRQTKSTGKSKDGKKKAQTLNETSYMTVGMEDQDQFTREQMREHSNSRKKHIEMNLKPLIPRTSGKQRSEKSGTRHDITHDARVLRYNSSDSESESDSKSEDDESKEILRMEEAYTQVRREKNRKITGKMKKADRSYGKSSRKKEIISHTEYPSISSQSTSYEQSIPEGSYCICDIPRQFPNMIDNCLAGSSAPIPHEEQSRRHRKNEKTMETPANIEHSDVSCEHLPDFNCEVCDCEPCGTLSTFHLTSGETRNDASTNVPSRRTKKNQTVSEKIARTNE